MSGYTYCEICGHRLAAGHAHGHRHAFAAFDSMCATIAGLQEDKEQLIAERDAIEQVGGGGHTIESLLIERIEKLWGTPLLPSERVAEKRKLHAEAVGEGGGEG